MQKIELHSSPGAMIEGLQQMDQMIITEVYDLFALPIQKYLMKMCRDMTLAEEIVSDTFVKLLEELSAQRGPQKNVRAYLFTTAYNNLIFRKRITKRRDGGSTDDFEPKSTRMRRVLVASSMPIEDKIVTEEELESLMKAMGQLASEKRKEVLRYRFLEDLTLEETAKIMGETVENVKVLQHRSRKELLKKMNENEKGSRTIYHRGDTSAKGAKG